MQNEASFINLLSTYGLRPERLSLYEEAFTHPSFDEAEKEERKDYERLEFLGDALMGLVASELCYRLHPEMEEGNLSVIKSQIIRTESEARLALKLGLLPFVRVGPSFQKKIEETPSVLENVFESFLGALFLDVGFEKAHDFLYAFLYDDVAAALPLVSKNPKSELQEALQSDHREAVSYHLVSESGPSHDKSFEVAVYFEGEEIGRGKGKSKKEAEQEAARMALSKRAVHSHGPYLPPLGSLRADGMSLEAARTILGEK